jgi:hypothetical protein
MTPSSEGDFGGPVSPPRHEAGPESRLNRAADATHVGVCLRTRHEHLERVQTAP